MSCFPALRLISLRAARRHSDFALNWPFMACLFFDVSLLSFPLFLFDPEKFRSLIFYKSVRFNSWLHSLKAIRLTLQVYYLFTRLFFRLSFADIRLEILSRLCVPASTISVPLNLIRLLLSLFQILPEGFTKTAICQGHRLHFAICCKIKLGEVV